MEDQTQYMDPGQHTHSQTMAQALPVSVEGQQTNPSRVKALLLSDVFEQPDLSGFLFEIGSESQRKALLTAAPL